MTNEIAIIHKSFECECSVTYYGSVTLEEAKRLSETGEEVMYCPHHGYALFPLSVADS